MELVEEKKGDVLIIRISGRLDATTSPQVEERVNATLGSGQKKIVFNMQKVDYLSSAGMRLLLSCTKKAKAQGGILTLCALQSNVAEIIKVAGFHQILRIVPTEESALQG